MLQRAAVVLMWAALAAAPVSVSPAHAAAACGAPARGPSYVLPSQADLIALLPPPPPHGSDAEQRDLQAVLDAQRDAHAHGGVAHAVADAAASCARFADVLGDALTAKRTAKVLAFLDRAARDGDAMLGPVKTYWKRRRPYIVSAQVERLGDMAPDWKDPRDLDTHAAGGAVSAGCTPSAPSVGAAAAHSRATAEQQQADKAKAAQKQALSSFPSGHAAYGTVCAILLADMVPEKRTQLFARASDFSHARLVLGAHFPTDLAAGRIAGTVATMLMMQSAQFQRDYAEARLSLRASLGLPLAAPSEVP